MPTTLSRVQTGLATRTLFPTCAKRPRTWFTSLKATDCHSPEHPRGRFTSGHSEDSLSNTEREDRLIDAALLLTEQATQCFTPSSADHLPTTASTSSSTSRLISSWTNKVLAVGLCACQLPMDLSTESEQTTLSLQLVATAELTNLALQLTHALVMVVP